MLEDSRDLEASIAEFRARPEARRLVVSLLGKPWAIERSVLQQLHAIALRQSEGPEAIGIKLGRPLEGTRAATERDGVAIVPVIGPIIPRGGMIGDASGITSVARISADIASAVANPDIRAIMLEVDSPGGVVTGISDLAREIRSASEIKPVTAFVSGAAASAAYWLASAASRIVTEDTGVLGSIGIIQTHQHQEVPDRDGNRMIDIVSSSAPGKRPDPTTDAGRAEIVAYIDKVEAIFVDAVAAYRGVTAEIVRSDFGRGGVLVGADAVAAGMADEVSTFEETLRDVAARDENEDPAGSAARPQSEGNEDMEFTALTLDQLRAERPDLIEAIASDARSAGALVGRSEGAEAERARLTGILGLAAAMPAEGSIVRAAIEGDDTVEQTAMKMVAASAEQKAAGLKALADGDPEVPEGCTASGLEDGDDEDGIEDETHDPVESAAKAEWNKSKATRREFGGDFAAFFGFFRAEKSGLVRAGRSAD